MTHQRTRTGGFTLIELMITVAVVAILGTIAVSSYSNYVKKANRTDATRTLMADAQALQRCYSQNFTYTPAGGCIPGAGTTPSPRGLYSVQITITSSTAYTIVARPATTPQTTDAPCAQFILDSLGKQSSLNSTGTDSTATCWGAAN